MATTNGSSSHSDIDPIVLTSVWTRVQAIADEVGTSIARAGFSTVLRENHDFSCGLFDENGTMLAQSSQSATGHIGAMPYLARTMLEHFPHEDWEEGDVFITNDPWIGCGHSNDLYLGTPVYRDGSIVGFVITSAHQMDIGGRIASTEAREVYEEGILFPPLKFYRRGEPNHDLHEMLRSNVRFADQVLGDMRAQVGATFLGAQRLGEVLDQYRLASLAPVAEAITATSERRMREEIARIPDGEFENVVRIDVNDAKGEPLEIRVRVVIDGDRIICDFEGTSDEVDKPINCVLNYTRSYTVLGIKLILAPFLPNNDGSYRPIEIRAPEGSILNTRFPAACHWRHFVGLRVPDAIFGAIKDAVPDRILAGSGASPVWLFTMSGRRGDGAPFLLNAHVMGGLGARPDVDGVSAVTYPPNVRDIPAEIIETETPLLVRHRQLRQDSGGAGRFRGGLGEEFSISAWEDGDLDPSWPVAISVFPGHLREPATGVFGGADSTLGEITIDDVPEDGAAGHEGRLSLGQTLTYRTPGGGGYGSPAERDPQLVEADVRNGYVSVAAAKESYGYKADSATDGAADG